MFLIDTKAEPNSSLVAYPLTALGRALTDLGRAREALAPLERALRIREARDSYPRAVAETRFALARALWETDADRARAVRLATQARETFRAIPGEGSSSLVEAWLATRRSPRHSR